MNDERLTLIPITAKLLDGQQVTSAREERIRLRQLPDKLRWAHKMLGLALHLLISVTKLCDAGCTANFTKIGRETICKGQTILWE